MCMPDGRRREMVVPKSGVLCRWTRLNVAKNGTVETVLDTYQLPCLVSIPVCVNLISILWSSFRSGRRSTPAFHIAAVLGLQTSRILVPRHPRRWGIRYSQTAGYVSSFFS